MSALALSQVIQTMQILHSSQKRKYTGEHYWTHLAAVAGLAQKYYSLVSDQVDYFVYMAVTWSHDCREDQGISEVTLAEMAGVFSDPKDREDYIYGVNMLSDLEEGNREVRKTASRLRLSKAKPWVQAIKCADKQHNMDSIFLKDPQFFNVFAAEATEMIEMFSPQISQATADVMGFIETRKLLQYQESVCPECSTGKLRVNTYRIPYLDKTGTQFYIPDQEGHYCTKCGHADFTKFPKSQEKIDNVIRKGGVLVV